MSEEGDASSLQIMAGGDETSVPGKTTMLDKPEMNATTQTRPPAVTIPKGPVPHTPGLPGTPKTPHTPGVKPPPSLDGSSGGEAPTSGMLSPGQQPQSPDPVHDLPPELLEVGWRRFWSRREGRPYFFNKVSNESRWEMPGQVCIIIPT